MIAALLFAAACTQATSPDDLDEPLLRDFGRGTLTISTADGTRHPFTIYVADTPDELSQGLMFVEELPHDAGMLFLFARNRQASMWMKNTVLSLDMLFIRSSGEIESIVENTTPGSLKSVRSEGTVCCVLELNAGTTRRLGIRPGDRVEHPAFKAQ